MKLKNQIILISITLFTIGCNNRQMSNTDKNLCVEEWNFQNVSKNSDIVEKTLNDTIKQQIIFDKIWFEIINEKEHEGKTIAFQKFYRTDGTLEEEGLGIYTDHPVVDFKKRGNGNIIHVMKNC